MDKELKLFSPKQVRLNKFQITQLGVLLSWQPFDDDEKKSYLDGVFHKDDIKKILEEG